MLRSLSIQLIEFSTQHFICTCIINRRKFIIGKIKLCLIFAFIHCFFIKAMHKISADIGNWVSSYIQSFYPEIFT